MYIAIYREPEVTLLFLKKNHYVKECLNNYFKIEITNLNYPSQSKQIKKNYFNKYHKCQV